jgi:hypothetical protein
MRAPADFDELGDHIADGLRRVDFVRAGGAEQGFDRGKMAEDEPAFFNRLAIVVRRLLSIRLRSTSAGALNRTTASNRE